MARREVGDCGHVGWDRTIRVGAGGRNIGSESGQIEKAFDRVIIVGVVGGQRLEAARYAYRISKVRLVLMSIYA